MWTWTPAPRKGQSSKQSRWGPELKSIIDLGPCSPEQSDFYKCAPRITAASEASIAPRLPIPTMMRVFLDCGLRAVRVAAQLVSALWYGRLRVLLQKSMHPRNRRWLQICQVVAFLLIALYVVEAQRLVADGPLRRDRCVSARAWRAWPKRRNGLPLLHIV